MNIDAIVSQQSKQSDPKDEIHARIQEALEQFVRSLNESRQRQIYVQNATSPRDRQVDTTSQITQLPKRYMEIATEEADPHYISEFLSQLWYPGMADRHERIIEAHKKTFEWIYRDSEVSNVSGTGFVNWLENGVGPYW